ncbi:L-gulonolactone oxidase-like isoform X2 [Anneissia japonica]|uniref:L-gulonolactone oxidase-like isoform X2 n=1 Tax=Anneissia japonica TaxID=1529436 RepID=UPI001425A119|nr:L-gulonolactone oxidase-like isoform X2 [Anneissia japonica]
MKILEKAKENDKKIRVSGKGHSPSDIVCTTDYILNLDLFDNVLEVDEENCRIKFEAGMTVKKLNQEILPKYNMALTIQGSASDITVAGSISTGTHGTGKNIGIMSTYIAELEFLTADGKMMKCSREENKELFLAALCGLGCLGIITSITLQCEPHFKLHQKQLSCTLDEMLENLDGHICKSEYFRFCYFPHTDGVVYWEVDKTTCPMKSSANWFWDYAIGYHLLQFLYWISTFFPSLVPIINVIYYRFLHSSYREDIDDYYKIFDFECLFVQYVTDWAIPRENAAKALRDLVSWLEANPDTPAHFPVEVRFTKADDIFLSPCYGRDSCYINILKYRPYGKYVEIEKYWTAYETIMLKYDGRPHWAKAHKLTYKGLQNMYPEFQRFCEIREKLDPDGRFMNNYMQRVFVPKSKSD